MFRLNVSDDCHVTRVCRVLAWMSENEHVAATTQYSTDNSDKGSSHRRSHKRWVTCELSL